MGGPSFWSRIRESNPPSRLGKPLYYRYTNPALREAIIAKRFVNCNHFLSVPEGTRYIIVSVPSSRNRATVRRTVAFDCFRPSRYKNNPNPQMWFGLFFFGTNILMGLFRKRCHTNGFWDFRAADFLVFTSQCNSCCQIM